jgi:hypothetical protein
MLAGGLRDSFYAFATLELPTNLGRSPLSYRGGRLHEILGNNLIAMEMRRRMFVLLRLLPASDLC